MSELKRSTTPIELNRAPGWLAAMLRLSYEHFGSDGAIEESIPSESSNRYREAAGIALSLAKLRKERERIGFVPLALSDYVLGLVKVADISISPILRWLGIDDLSRPTLSSAKAVARLSRELGMDLREALVHIRIGFASQIDTAPLPLLVARLRATGAHRTQLEECEAVLGEIESEYELDIIRELRSTEFEIRAAYRESESEPRIMR
jgi:hypothetical protein